MVKIKSQYFSRCLPIAILLVMSCSIPSAFAATIDVTSYGATGDGVTDDTTAIQSAVNALVQGDTLLFPQCSNFYRLQLGANLTINNKDNIRIIIRGKISVEGLPESGEYVFDVLYSDGIEFIGQGGDAIIEGDDQYMYEIDDVAGPCFIRFTVCNRCIVQGITFRNGPHFSVSLRSCEDNKILDCTFLGGPQFGPAVTGSTQIQGLMIFGSIDIIVKGNCFFPSASGGKAYSWIGGANTNRYITIVENRFESSFDHSIYTGMHESVVANNTFHDCDASSIKINAQETIIANNTIYSSKGGAIDLPNASRSIIANNTVDGFNFTGLEVYPYGGYTGDSLENLIEGNFLRG